MVKMMKYEFNAEERKSLKDVKEIFCEIFDDYLFCDKGMEVPIDPTEAKKIIDILDYLLNC